MESNEEVKVDTTNNEVEGQDQEIVSISKSDYEKLHQDLGSLKRELKDLRKSSNETFKETTKKTEETSDNKSLERLEKLAFKMANIDHEDDIDLARRTAKKWNMDVEDVLNDEDFKVKLEKQQNQRSNTLATSGIKGSGSQSQAKLNPEYWIAKGVPPTPNDIPDRQTRSKIVQSMISHSKVGKKFYNE